MELNYSLSKAYFLEYQLYTASKSKTIRNQKLRNYFYVSATYLILCIYMYNHNKLGFWYFLPFSIFMMIALPFYMKWKYKSHYKKFIDENYSERFGLKCKLRFEENKIVEESKLGESKINYESLNEINEIQNYYFLKMLTAQSLIIPKK